MLPDAWVASVFVRPPPPNAVSVTNPAGPLATARFIRPRVCEYVKRLLVSAFLQSLFWFFIWALLQPTGEESAGSIWFLRSMITIALVSLFIDAFDLLALVASNQITLIINQDSIEITKYWGMLREQFRFCEHYRVEFSPCVDKARVFPVYLEIYRADKLLRIHRTTDRAVWSKDARATKVDMIVLRQLVKETAQIQ